MRAHRVQDVAPGSGRHVSARPAMVAVHVIERRRGRAARGLRCRPRARPAPRPDPLPNSRRFIFSAGGSEFHRRVELNLRPPAAPVTLPKLELVMLVVGLLQRTKLNGLVASARTTARRRSLIGMRLASESDSLFLEKPRTQSSTRAVLPNAKVEGVSERC